MRKKIQILTVLMLLVCILPIFAVITLDTTEYPEGTPYAQLNIKAYKNTPDPILMTVYDALTGNLGEISKEKDIDIYPYLGNFVSDNLSAIPKVEQKNKVLFSYSVAGGSTGKFNMKIELTCFDGPYVYVESENGGDWKLSTETQATYIDTYYEMKELRALFPRTGKPVSSNSFYTASTPVVTATNNIAVDGVPVIFSIDWDILPKDPTYDEAIGDFWVSEGVVMMVIRETGAHGYKDKSTPAGRYKATVTLTLSPRN